MDTMKQGRGTIGDPRPRLSSGLVVAQLTLSLVLVVAAGLFIRTFTSLASRPLGFDADRVLVATVSAQRTPIDPGQRVPAFERALQAVRLLPGVSYAAASLTTPVSGRSLENQISVMDAGRTPDGKGVALVNHVSPAWFRTFGTPVLAGRDFADSDGPGAPPVAIVNETFALAFLGGASPIGHAIAGLPVAAQVVPIVGMAKDAVYRSLRAPVPPTIYLPFAQSREVAAFASMTLSIRSSGGSATELVRGVSRALNAVNPNLTWTFRQLDEQIDASITQERITAVLSGLFGTFALLLAGLGLYGVTAYSVSRRRSEIALRVALGASTGMVIRFVVRRVLLLVGLGAATGLVASVWLSGFLEALLYGLEPRDTPTLVGAVLVLLSVGLIAGALPALRAARIEPATVLREN
jgi:predicted permease